MRGGVPGVLADLLFFLQRLCFACFVIDITGIVKTVLMCFP